MRSRWRCPRARPPGRSPSKSRLHPLAFHRLDRRGPRHPGWLRSLAGIPMPRAGRFAPDACRTSPTRLGNQTCLRTRARNARPRRCCRKNDAHVELLDVQVVTRGYFEVLGVRAAVGRLFGPDEYETPGVRLAGDQRGALAHTIRRQYRRGWRHDPDRWSPLYRCGCDSEVPAAMSRLGEKLNSLRSTAAQWHFRVVRLLRSSHPAGFAYHLDSHFPQAQRRFRS